MYISQISVYLENGKGTLSRLTKLLSSNHIDLLALTIADTSGFGIARLIVREENIDGCLALLQSAGYSARKNKVLCVRVTNEPGGLDKVLSILDDAGISIEYLYSFHYSAGRDALLILRLNDRETGAAALQKAGVAVVSKEEISAL
ncbi:MAG: hypothetical protein Q4C48_02235 [Lachnospiraceae bacterium]|nr:hypothetical protein [Lachnospiraceae bacterium]